MVPVHEEMEDGKMENGMDGDSKVKVLAGGSGAGGRERASEGGDKGCR